MGTGVGGELWGALPLPALLLDEAGCVVDANAAAEIFLNRSAKAAAGRSVGAVLEIDGGIAEAVARVRADDAPLTLHGTLLELGPSNRRTADLHFSPVGASSVGAIMLLVVPRDIAGRLDRARTSRTAARSVIGMAEMLAHEIKNPLAGIAGAAQLLATGLAGEDLELTDLIVAETRRIAKLLEQVERFGDLRPPQRTAVNIHDILDRARRSAMVGSAAHMEISEEYDPSLPPAWIDGDQILQVMSNLLNNAAQAGGQGGRIVIRTFYEAGFHMRAVAGRGNALPLQVQIVDDGPGVPPDLLPNLFEPFVSGRENGTGLGLALVAKIVSAHDGLISVDSRPGRTAFQVSLPRLPNSSHSSKQPTE